MVTSRDELLKKYNIPVPRYTSYPTVPYWSDTPTTAEWIDSLDRALQKENPSVSIYVHIPFCETLCTFCGCNTSITKNHAVEEPYVQALQKEIDLYFEQLPRLNKIEIKELHLGGGTPTYFSEDHLDLLVSSVLEHLNPSNDAEFSIEVDPRRTRKTQLEVLYKRGFRRISLGVQDFDPEVQRIINRIQPFEKTEMISEAAREIGYHSVNFDLIYGLPKQTISSIEKSMELTLKLRPDRIAFYSYAHVPWIKASQRLFTEDDLPKGEEKRKLYELGRKYLEDAGYVEIGMDHFALPVDSLYQSFLKGKLHRNFMGYTSLKTDVLLGLGTSAISESPDCFHQNEKLEVKYRKILSEGLIPTFKGHKLNENDIKNRQLVLKFMTSGKVNVPQELLEDSREYLSEMLEDHLITWEGSTLKITDIGKPFLRIVCTVFDERLRASRPTKNLFSGAI
jgi:coproporphyrinogen III oxidase/oxygen-independent coproporphyrinogen-3 oxidase